MELYKVYEGHVDMFLFDTKCQSVGGSGKQNCVCGGFWQCTFAYQDRPDSILEKNKLAFRCPVSSVLYGASLVFADRSGLINCFYIDIGFQNMNEKTRR